MSTWPPARRRAALLALLAATVTGALAVVLDPPGPLWTAGLHLGLTAAALSFPAGIAVQVIGGQALLAVMLLGPAAPHPVLLAPVAAGVVATAELLAVVARLDTPLSIEGGRALGRVGVSAGIGAGAYAAVALLSGLPGPGGLLAVVLASGAVFFLATRLVREETSPAG